MNDEQFSAALYDLLTKYKMPLCVIVYPVIKDKDGGLLVRGFCPSTESTIPEHFTEALRSVIITAIDLVKPALEEFIADATREL